MSKLASSRLAPSGPPSTAHGLAAGLLTVAAVTALKLVLASSVGYPTPYLLYFGAVLVAAWYGSLAAGLVTTLVGVSTGYLVFAGASGEASDLLAAAVATFECATIAVITSGLRASMFASQQSGRDVELALEQVRAVIVGVSDGVTMQDATGRFVFANDIAARLTGLASGEEMLAAAPAALASQFELFREDGSPYPVEDVPARVVLRGGEPHTALIGFRRIGDDEMRWRSVTASAVRDARGALQYVVNTFRDVTDERRRMDELHVSRGWLETTLRSIGDAVVTTDEEGRITLLNGVAEQITGWSQVEAIGKALDDVFVIFNETTRASVESPVGRVLREGVIVALANHTVLRRRDGSECSIDDSAAPIRDAAGTLVGVVLVFRDVSRQRRDELRRAFMARVSTELSSSLDYRTTLASVARLAVPTIADWCAVDMKEEGNAHPQRLAVAHTDATKVALVDEIEKKYPSDPNAPTGVPNVLRTGKPEMMAHIPRELISAAAVDAEHLRLIELLSLRSYIAAPIKPGERTIGVVTLVMAESNRRYDHDDLLFVEELAQRAAIAIQNAGLYREAQRLRAEAEAANRSKDEFLAVLGHELRNPLAPIVTALHLMDARANGALERERSVVKRQVGHMTRLVDDLLDVSRITQGKVELTRRPLDIDDVIEDALEMAGPLIQARGQALLRAIPTGLAVSGDRGRLAQVFSNIVQNAAKYGHHDGHIWVSAAAEAGQVVVRVRDDGVGIAPGMVERVFELFAQAQQGADRTTGGLGLGLAIVRGLVQQHGGSVEARSEGVGRGAEIVVRLPLHEAATAVPAEPPAGAPSSGRERVLVVDDHADGRDMMAIALEAQGHIVFTAVDGADAIAVAMRERPTIAVLDVGLPGMSGYELAKRMRELPELGGIALIANTGYGRLSDREQAREAGFDDHLTKPVSMDVLADAIARAASKRQTSHT